MNVYTLLFALLNTVILLFYISDSHKKRGWKSVYPIISSLVFGIVVVLLLQESLSETTAYFVLNFSVLFSILPFYYITGTRKLFAYLVLIFIEFFYITLTYGSILYPFIQMLAIGTGIGVAYRSGVEVFGQRQHNSTSAVETKRDLVHILLGVMILSLFLVLKFYYAVYAVTTLILIGYLYNSTMGNRKSSSLYKILNSFERPDSLYGLGALYLGVGVLLLIGFIHNTHFVIIGIAALLFADPIATIVGINTKGPKLFYNKKKSVYGTLAFFAVVALMGYPIIGYYSILFGIGLALVESIKLPLDDNIAISVVMIVLYVVFLAGMGQLPF